jgi:hypothetical protein
MKWAVLFIFVSFIYPQVSRADGPQLSCEELMARLVDPGFVPPLDPKTIHYKIYGADNKETVILIHGLGGDLGTWELTAKKLY